MAAVRAARWLGGGDWVPAAGEEFPAEGGVLVFETAEPGAEAGNLVGVSGLQGPDVVPQCGFNASRRRGRGAGGRCR